MTSRGRRPTRSFPHSMRTWSEQTLFKLWFKLWWRQSGHNKHYRTFDATELRHIVTKEITVKQLLEKTNRKIISILFLCFKDSNVLGGQCSIPILTICLKCLCPFESFCVPSLNLDVWSMNAAQPELQVLSRGNNWSVDLFRADKIRSMERPVRSSSGPV